jgi:sulfur-carrier protein
VSVVRIPPVLRSEAGGARQVEADGATLRELIENLSAQLPELGARIYGEGELHSFVNVYVDGEDVRLRSGLETPVRSDTTVILLPAMAGGGG